MMIKKTDGKSKDELERAASHVLYELNMLCDAIELYNKNMTDEKLKNCFFVTLCVHARSVINFISPSHWNGLTVRPDDILAKHFLEESEIKLLEFELTELSKTEPLIKNPLFWDRINKGIVHLSYKRLEEASLEISFFFVMPLKKHLEKFFSFQPLGFSQDARNACLERMELISSSLKSGAISYSGNSSYTGA